MKCFKNCFILICVSFGIISVSPRNIDPASPNCDTELRLLRQRYDTCAPKRFDITDILRNIDQYRNQTLNSTEFSEAIMKYCVTLNYAASCSIDEATTVSVACRDQDSIQFLLNLMRIVNRVANDLCSEEIIFEIAGDKGFNCLYAVGFHRATPYQVIETSLQNENVCQTTQSLQSSTNEIFEGCENDGILKKYYNRLLNGISQEFSCA